MPNANLANATTLVAEGHMPMEDHEVIVQLATEVRALAEEHRELTFAQREQAHETRELTAQVVRMNGRLGKLEGAEYERQLREAEERGRMKAAGDVILTKANLAKLAAVAGVVPTVVTIVSKLAG